MEIRFLSSFANNVTIARNRPGKGDNTRRSTYRGEVFKSRVWGKVPEGSSLIFGDTRIFLTQFKRDRKKLPCQKASAIRASVSTEHRLMTDGPTDNGPLLVPALAYAK